MNTKNRLLAAVRQKPLTVAELCEQLGVTRTAVNLPLKQLLAEGLVQIKETVRSGQAGKPAVRYEATAGTEDLGSTAYQPVLTAFLQQVKAELGDTTLVSLLEQTGRTMAQNALTPKDDFSENLNAAIAVANSLGATAQVKPQIDGNLLITNHTCPAASTVRTEGHICRLFTSFFSEATGHEVHDKCLRSERVMCRYLVMMHKRINPA